MSFETNLGQTDARVKFVSRTSAYTLFLTATEAVFVFAKARPAGEPAGLADPDGRAGPFEEVGLDEVGPGGPGEPPETAVVRMAFKDANPEVQVMGEEIQAGISNYFVGNDPSKWVTEVPNYSKVRYEKIWPGIDLVFYENQDHALEYDFVLAPGADPAAIALEIGGAQGLRLTGRGELAIATPLGEVSQHAPVAYQEPGGARIPRDATWQVEGSTARFALGDYDPSLPLVIDPALVAYSSYLGGSGNDAATGVAVDSAGSAYLTGYTDSANFPSVNPFQGGAGGVDAFVTKLNPAGSAKVYSSYLGGSGDDLGNGIGVDSAGSAYLAGYTDSSDFPTISPFQVGYGGGRDDAFVTKLNAAGSAEVYSSYLGGSADDRAYRIAIDAGGNAYVTGLTSSTNFPTTSPFQAANGGGPYDAFVTKVNAAGSAKAYSSYLGGNGDDRAADVAVDSSGNAYMAGRTNSKPFPTTSPFQGTYGGGASDAFIAKVNAAGSAKVYSSHLGGTGEEGAYGVDVDSAGEAYLVGYTTSADFPLTSAFQGSFGGGTYDAFFTKVNSAGSAKLESSYLGGDYIDVAYDVAAEPAGNAHLVGYSDSYYDFPTSYPFQSGFMGVARSAFVCKWNFVTSGLEYCSLYGGTASDWASGVAVDSSAAAYVAGATVSTDFPTAYPFQASTGGGGMDAFVGKVALFPARANTTSAGAQSSGPAQRPSVSDGGRYVAFHSPAADLVGGDTNGAGDVFVKNTQNGSMTRASVTSAGSQASGGSRFPWITPDGRYLAFMGDAADLVPGDTNGAEDIFVRDRTLGTTERVNLSSAEVEAAAGNDSRFPQITPDGRYVVFQSQAANLVAGDTNGRWDVFVRDRTLGTTERVSLTSGEAQGGGSSVRPSISDDGRYVVFHSWAANLVPGDTNGKADVFVRDRTLGTTSRVSVSTAGGQGNDESLFPRISGNGSVVAFHSVATNLAGSDTNSVRDTFVRELGTSTTSRVSVDSLGAQASSSTGYAAISADGRYVAFHGIAWNLVAGDSNGQQDIFVRDRVVGDTRRASDPRIGAEEANGLSGSAAISADGGYLAFHSLASNFVGADTNLDQDVFYCPTPW